MVTPSPLPVTTWITLHEGHFPSQGAGGALPPREEVPAGRWHVCHCQLRDERHVATYYLEHLVESCLHSALGQTRDIFGVPGGAPFPQRLRLHWSRSYISTTEVLEQAGYFSSLCRQWRIRWPSSYAKVGANCLSCGTQWDWKEQVQGMEKKLRPCTWLSPRRGSLGAFIAELHHIYCQALDSWYSF